MATNNSVNTYIVPTTDNEVTMPSQPAWNAYVSGDIANVTGDATVYTIIWNAELLDQGGNFNTGTGTYTAPVDGNYQFQVNLTLGGLTASHTSGVVNIIAGEQTSTVWAGNPGALRDTSNELTISGGIFIRLSATNTATVTVMVSGSTKVVDVIQFYTKGSNFSGFLVC